MKKFLTCLICIILLGCNSGIDGGTDNGNQNPDDPQVISSTKLLSLSSVATIPTTVDQQSSATLLLTNNTGEVVHGITISFAGGEHAGANINSRCNTDLQPGQSCQVGLSLSAELQQGSFLLGATGISASGQYNARQLVSYGNIVTVNGIEVGEFNSQVVAASGSRVTLAIPFRKAGNYFVQARVDSSGDSDPFSETVCNNDNSQCTELVSIAPHSDEEVNVSFLNNSIVFTTVSTAVVMNTVGNLITSANNVIVSKADGVTTTPIQLFNTGYTPISNIRFSSTNSAFGFNIGECSSIAAGSSCTATVTANSKTNGFGSINVLYDTVSTIGQPYLNNNTSFNVSYVAESSAAGFGLTVSGDTFINNWVGESRNAYLTIKNTGSTKLDSINITSVASQNAYVSVSGYGVNACVINGTQSLEPDSSCVVRVSYTPLKPDAGNLVINFSGKYLDSKDISGSGKISVLSDAINLNYNSNPRVVYLMTNNGVDNSQNGVTSCNLSNNGKSLTGCFTTGAGGVLNNTHILGLSTFMSNDGTINAYVGVFHGEGNFAKCNTTESGFLSNCSSMMSSSQPMSGLNGNNVQNTIANINGKNYLYTTMWNSGKKINKCLISDNNGSLSNCVSEASNINDGSTPYFRGIVINNSYAYMVGQTNSNVWICKINQTSGDFYNCVKTDIGVPNPYIPIIKTLGSTKYLFVSNEDSSNGSIYRCSINSSGLVNNDCVKAFSSGISGFRGMTLLTINGLDYFYYTNKNDKSKIYRTQLNSDGTISTNKEEISTSGAVLDGIEYLSPLTQYPRAQIAYAANSNIYYPNTTRTEYLYVAASSLMGSTTVTLNAPAGITVTPSTVTFDMYTTSVPISISVASNVAAGTYTIAGTATNGLSVPDFVVNIVNPTIASYTPISGNGISNNLSTSVNTDDGRQLAAIIFSQPMNLSSGTINGIKLQTSSDNTTFADVANIAYNWNVSSDKKTVTLKVSGSTSLVSGNYYRIMIDKSLIKDLYGNPIPSATVGYEELTRFRAALKVFVTASNFNGNLGGLSGADSKCNSDSSKPNDGYTYKAILAAGKYGDGTDQRFPGTNWILRTYTKYYKAASLSTALGQTDDLGRLDNYISLGGNSAWTGFNGSDWGIQEVAIGDNWACNNWTNGDGGVFDTIKGYSHDPNGTGKGWIRGGDAVCTNWKNIICAQQ